MTEEKIKKTSRLISKTKEKISVVEEKVQDAIIELDRELNEFIIYSKVKTLQITPKIKLEYILIDNIGSEKAWYVNSLEIEKFQLDQAKPEEAFYIFPYREQILEKILKILKETLTKYENVLDKYPLEIRTK